MHLDSKRGVGLLDRYALSEPFYCITGIFNLLIVNC